MFELSHILEDLGLDAIGRELRIIAEETKRRYGGRRAKPRFGKLTPELEAKIRDAAWRFPNASQQQLATLCGTNPGRVSEALTGFRDGRDEK